MIEEDYDDDDDDLQTIMGALSKTGKEYDMKINAKKTKVMRFLQRSKREESNSRM